MAILTELRIGYVSKHVVSRVKDEQSNMLLAAVCVTHTVELQIYEHGWNKHEQLPKTKLPMWTIDGLKYVSMQGPNLICFAFQNT